MANEKVVEAMRNTVAANTVVVGSFANKPKEPNNKYSDRVSCFRDFFLAVQQYPGMSGFSVPVIEFIGAVNRRQQLLPIGDKFLSLTPLFEALDAVEAQRSTISKFYGFTSNYMYTYLRSFHAEGVIQYGDRKITVVSKPVVAKPVVAKPVVAKPVAPTPVVAKPVVAKPVAAKPVVPTPPKPVATKQTVPTPPKPVARTPLTAETTAPVAATPSQPTRRGPRKNNPPKLAVAPPEEPAPSSTDKTEEYNDLVVRVEFTHNNNNNINWADLEKSLSTRFYHMFHLARRDHRGLAFDHCMDVVVTNKTDKTDKTVKVTHAAKAAKVEVRFLDVTGDHQNVYAEQIVDFCRQMVLAPVLSISLSIYKSSTP